jgi:hypothetical protein
VRQTTRRSALNAQGVLRNNVPIGDGRPDALAAEVLTAR